ncbi:PEP-CTERM sorting domain-containing protein [Microseira sp. BLCC-F43]|uniref:PEP-CTERM sorting domain-containing protein n=1 Tax=Microseira sp. BLCC-F43 TaxID=3153602 RepID=UPI0035B8F0BA
MKLVKTLALFTTLAGSALMALVTGEVAQAASITAQTRGLDSGINTAVDRNSFFGVSFDQGSVGTFIKSFSIDLSPDSNASFDITPFPFALGPSSGVAASDILSSVLSNSNKMLTVTLADGAFVAGEFLRFGIDTDRVGSSFFGLDPFDPGIDFGLAGAKFTATLSNGQSGTSVFQPVSLIPSVSQTTLDIPEPTSVPEPASVLGLLAFGAMGAGSTLKRFQQQKANG